jgi:hypothetical protein
VFSLSTIRGHDFTFQCVAAEDFHELVSYMLDGLKKRSHYVIAMQDYKPPGMLLSSCFYFLWQNQKDHKPFTHVFILSL